jgi:hypothetical protein
LLKSKRSIKLNKELSCEYICKNIQELMNDYTSQNIDLSNYILVCELKEITDSNQSLLLRIGVKDE